MRSRRRLAPGIRRGTKHKSTAQKKKKTDFLHGFRTRSFWPAGMAPANAHFRPLIAQRAPAPEALRLLARRFCAGFTCANVVPIGTAQGRLLQKANHP